MHFFMKAPDGSRAYGHACMRKLRSGLVIEKPPGGGMGGNMITCGFIGLGLIGGSIARAFKQNRTDIRIIACDPNPETLRLAHSQHVADAVYESPCSDYADCDYIFLCAPVSCNDNNLEKILPYKKKDCILTDVGSVKSPIFAQIRRLGLTDCFIGGHPMAGSERIGFANSKASLLENAFYILAPADRVPGEKVEAFRSLVLSTGAIPLLLGEEKHDYVTAAISHLPHLIASSLVNLVHGHDTDGLMKAIAAGGFKDITRIASSSPVMWQQICLTNSVNISSLLGDYIDLLSKTKALLDARNPDGLYTFFDQARMYRESFLDTASGPIKKSPVIRVEISDRAGAVANVATLLAQNAISIKNIGITHNREYEEGVLHIEFYDDNTIFKAVSVLAANGYTTHVQK